MERTGTDEAAGRMAARDLLRRAYQPWGLKSFALGWTKIDVLLRALVVLVLGITPVVMVKEAAEFLRENEAELQAHGNRSMAISTGATSLTKEEIARHYSALAAMAEGYRSKGYLQGKVQIYSLGLLGLLVVLAAIGEYRRFVAQTSLRQAIDHLKTHEGAEWLKSGGTDSAPKP